MASYHWPPRPHGSLYKGPSHQCVEDTIHNLPTHQTHRNRISLSLSIQLRSKARNNKEHKEHWWTLASPEWRIEVNSMKFSEIHHWILIIELETLQFQCESATKVANPHDHSGERRRNQKLSSNSEEEEVKNWFIFSFCARTYQKHQEHSRFKVFWRSSSESPNQLR